MWLKLLDTIAYYSNLQIRSSVYTIVAFGMSYITYYLIWIVKAKINLNPEIKRKERQNLWQITG